MTDDGAGNPRFAFIPKNVWDLLLDLAPIPLGGIALWFSVRFVVYLTRNLVGDPEELGPLGFAIQHENLVPTATAVGITLFFLVDGLFRRRKNAEGLDCEGFGRSRMLVVSGAIVLAMLAVLWCLHTIYTDIPGILYKSEAIASAGFGGAWAIAAVTALGLRRLGNRFEAICLLPPIACFAAMLLHSRSGNRLARTAVLVAESLQPGRRLGITPLGLVVLATIFLSVCTLPVVMWAEQRLFHSCRRTAGIACAGLWVLAAAIATLATAEPITDWFSLLFG